MLNLTCKVLIFLKYYGCSKVCSNTTQTKNITSIILKENKNYTS